MNGIELMILIPCILIPLAILRHGVARYRDAVMCEKLAESWRNLDN